MRKLKYKYIIVLFLVGVGLRTLGTLAKIMHTSNADWLLAVSSFLMIAVLIGIIKVIATKDKKSFLNQ